MLHERGRRDRGRHRRGFRLRPGRDELPAGPGLPGSRPLGPGRQRRDAPALAPGQARRLRPGRARRRRRGMPRRRRRPGRGGPRAPCPLQGPRPPPISGWPTSERCFCGDPAARPAAAAATAPIVLAVDDPGFAGCDLVGTAVTWPADVPVGDPAAFEAARIEAGRPVMGRDLSEKTIPQEAGLVERAVSLTKGCYTGQELVARLDARHSRVARRLVGFVIAPGDAAAGGEVVVGGGRSVPSRASPTRRARHHRSRSATSTATSSSPPRSRSSTGTTTSSAAGGRAAAVAGLISRRCPSSSADRGRRSPSIRRVVRMASRRRDAPRIASSWCDARVVGLKLSRRAATMRLSGPVARHLVGEQGRDAARGRPGHAGGLESPGDSLRGHHPLGSREHRIDDDDHPVERFRRLELLGPVRTHGSAAAEVRRVHTDTRLSHDAGPRPRPGGRVRLQGGRHPRAASTSIHRSTSPPRRPARRMSRPASRT